MPKETKKKTTKKSEKETKRSVKKTTKKEVAKKAEKKEPKKTVKKKAPEKVVKPEKKLFPGFAVIRIGGKQYKVKEEEFLLIEKIEGKEGDNFDVFEVLLVAEGENVKIGDPLVKDAKVKVSIVSQTKGEKLIIFKYKAKKRYRKKTGHRQKLTQIKIEKIQM